MNLLYPIVLIGTIVGAIFFGYQAEKNHIGTQKRRTNIIIAIICLVIMIVAIIVRGMN